MQSRTLKQLKLWTYRLEKSCCLQPGQAPENWDEKLKPSRRVHFQCSLYYQQKTAKRQQEEALFLMCRTISLPESWLLGSLGKKSSLAFQTVERKRRGAQLEGSGSWCWKRLDHIHHSPSKKSLAHTLVLYALHSGEFTVRIPPAAKIWKENTPIYTIVRNTIPPTQPFIWWLLMTTNNS